MDEKSKSGHLLHPRATFGHYHSAMVARVLDVYERPRSSDSRHRGYCTRLAINRRRVGTEDADVGERLACAEDLFCRLNCR